MTIGIALHFLQCGEENMKGKETRIHWGIEGATLFQNLCGKSSAPFLNGENYIAFPYLTTHAHRSNSLGSVAIGLISGWKPSVLLNSISVAPWLYSPQCGVISSATGWEFGSPNLTNPRNEPAKEAENCEFTKGVNVNVNLEGRGYNNMGDHNQYENIDSITNVVPGK